MLNIVLFISIAAFGVGYERILTEQSSIQTALTINHDMLIQYQNIELASQKSRESKALYFPTVDLNITLSEFNNASPLIVSNRQSNTSIYLPAQNSDDIYYNSRISILQNIYTGGRITAANKLAAMNIEKVKNESNSVRNTVILNIKKTFNKCLYYREKIEILKNSQNKNNAAQIKNSVALTELIYNKSVLDLLNIIGLELNTLIAIEGDFSAKIKDISLNQCLLFAYQFRPEIQTTQYQESIDELGVNLLSMHRYPIVTLGAAQEWAGKDIINDKSNWYVFLSVDLPVFDGGGTISRVLQGKITARQSALARAKAESGIRLAVSKAYIEYDFWKQKAFENNLLGKTKGYNDADLEIIKNLNDAYFELEFTTGVQLDTY
jgi:outer membrane protein TolC